MNRTAYPTGLCRTIYTNLRLDILSFKLENVIREDLIEMSDGGNMV